MTISFLPIDVRSSDKADFVEFLVGNAFPFHVHSHPSVEQISTAIDGGRYDGDDHASLWIDDDIRGRLGVVILEDLADGGPMFDLRLAEIRAGFVTEAYYREAWPADVGAVSGSVAYAILRRDWQSGTTTPVDWDDFPSVGHHGS